jgi:hypothetical protein
MTIARTKPRPPISALLLFLMLLVTVSCTAAPSTGQSPSSASPVSQVSPTPAGPPGREVEIQGIEHINKGDPHPPYNSTPPTSGPHWNIAGEAPVPWGIYRQPIPDEGQIHNLEHGGVMIQYNCRDCSDLTGQLEGFYNRYTAAHPLARYRQSTKIVIAPYYDMPTRLALTAWGKIDTMEAYDEARVTRFVDAYRDNGPEAVP